MVVLKMVLSAKELSVENFPNNVSDLLHLLAKIKCKKVTLILNTYEDCILEDVTLVNIIGSLVLIRYNEKFKFIRVDCICSVIIDCDIILGEFLDACSKTKF